MSLRFRKYGERSLFVSIVIFATLIFSISNHFTLAQVSCDNPPFDVSRIQTVWDKTDFCVFQDGVFNEIISGGVGRDGIPPIDTPIHESIEAGWEWLEAQSPVIAVEIDGVARAYPLAILTRHEIVNDQIGETPIAVTFCPLCNSALVSSIAGLTVSIIVLAFLACSATAISSCGMTRPRPGGSN